MIRIIFISITIILTFLLFACSIAPNKTVSQKELLRSRETSLYIIEDDIDGILKILNDKGEVVVNSKRFDNPVYLQIFSTPDGIKVRQFNKEEYDFIE